MPAIQLHELLPDTIMLVLFCPKRDVSCAVLRLSLEQLKSKNVWFGHWCWINYFRSTGNVSS
jgi:hypothetical protein